MIEKIYYKTYKKIITKDNLMTINHTIYLEVYEMMQDQMDTEKITKELLKKYKYEEIKSIFIQIHNESDIILLLEENPGLTIEEINHKLSLKGINLTINEIKILLNNLEIRYWDGATDKVIIKARIGKAIQKEIGETRPEETIYFSI
jgi:hypothetical protein